MAYKNSAGNSSISNELGQWRYFTSALAKLGTHKGGRVAIETPRTIVPEEVNWARAALTTTVNGMGLYESYREREYKKAEEYLNTHSLEDYKKQVQEHNVPIQYDYLAMSKLKEGMGRNLSKIVHQNFIENVDRNKFQGMSPEQVDAEYYAYLKESANEFNDGTLGFNTDDYYFNKGLYEDADKNRIATLIRHSKVEDDFLQQQFEQQTLADINSAVENTGEGLSNIYKLLGSIDNMGYRLTPELRSKFLSEFEKAVSNSQNGETILSAIKDYKLSDGQTFYEFMGGTDFEKARAKAASFSYTYNAQERFKLNDLITRAVRRGDYKTLQRLRDAEVAKFNNAVSAQAEALDEATRRAYNKSMDEYEAAIKEAQRAAKRAAEAQQKELEKLQRIQTITDYLYKQAQGQLPEGSPSLEMMKEATGATNNQIAIASQLAYQMVNQSLTADRAAAVEATKSGDDSYNRDLSASNYINYLTSTSASYEMKKEVQHDARQYISALNKTITDQINGKEALNSETGEAFSYRDPNTGLVKAGGFFVPKGFSSFYDLYTANPERFKDLLSEKDAELLTRFDNFVDRGLDPIAAMSDSDKVEELRKQYAAENGLTYNKFELLTSDLAINGLNNILGNSAIKENPQLRQMVLSAALKLKKDYTDEEGEIDFSELHEASTSLVGKQYLGLLDTVAIPKNDLLTEFPKLGSEFSSGGVDEDSLLEISNQAVRNILKNTKGLEIPEDDTGAIENSYYDYKAKAVKIVDSDNQLRAVVPAKAISMEAMNILDEQNRKERESREAFNRAVDKTKEAISKGYDTFSRNILESAKQQQKSQEALVEGAKTARDEFIEFFNSDDAPESIPESVPEPSTEPARAEQTPASSRPIGARNSGTKQQQPKQQPSTTSGSRGQTSKEEQDRAEKFKKGFFGG